MNIPVNNLQPHPASHRGRRVSHAEFLRLWNDPTLTTAEIGRRLGCHQSAVCKRAAARGLPERGCLARIKIHDEALFREMWDAGVQIADMAAHFKVSPSNIKRACKRFGVTPRGKGDWRRAKTLSQFLQDRLARSWAVTSLRDQVMMIDAGMIERTNAARAHFRARGRPIV